MADENAKQVLVYMYDTTDRLHALTGAISVAEGTALTDGQTDVVTCRQQPILERDQVGWR